MNEKDREEIDKFICHEVDKVRDDLKSQLSMIKWLIGFVFLFIAGLEAHNYYNTAQMVALNKNFEQLSIDRLREKKLNKFIIQSFQIEVEALTNKDNQKDAEIIKKMNDLREDISNIDSRGIEIKNSKLSDIF